MLERTEMNFEKVKRIRAYNCSSLLRRFGCMSPVHSKILILIYITIWKNKKSEAPNNFLYCSMLLLDLHITSESLEEQWATEVRKMRTTANDAATRAFTAAPPNIPICRD